MFTLLPHQRTAVDALASGKVLCGGVGTGKSVTALIFYKENFSDRKLYVITTAMKRDTKDWKHDAEMAGVDIEAVDSWNNIKKYADVKDAFFIFDEQRIVGTGVWAKTFIKIAKVNKWVMLTATPGDTWLDYASLFIANGFYSNITHFKREHVIYSYYGSYPKIERYTKVLTLERRRNDILVEMPMERSTTRQVEHVYCKYDKLKIREMMRTRMNPESGEPFMNIAHLFTTMRKCIYTDRSRIDAVREVAARRDRVIIFYNYNVELKALLKVFPDAYVRCGAKHDPVPTGDKWVYLVQYIAGAEGWNCVETDLIIFYSLTYSYKQFEQAMGRIDRLNTKYQMLNYVIFRAPGSVDDAVWKALKSKKNFNERAFMGEK